MNANLNLNDLSKLGIPEEVVAQCFAQKGISVTRDDLVWMRRSFINNSCAPTNSTLQEGSAVLSKTNQSFVSIHDHVEVPSQSIIEFQKDEANVKFATELAEFAASDVTGAEKLVLQHSESVFTSRSLSAVDDFAETIASWMATFEKHRKTTFFYLSLHVHFARFQVTKSEVDFIRFHALKADIWHSFYKGEGDATGFLGLEKLLNAVEVLDQEMAALLQKLQSNKERFAITDLSNVNCLKELHLGEFLKVDKIALGNSHIVWSCLAGGKRLLFGMGDNSFCQVAPRCDLKYLSKPLLIRHTWSASVQSFSVNCDVSCSADENSVYVWGKSVGESLAVVERVDKLVADHVFYLDGCVHLVGANGDVWRSSAVPRKVNWSKLCSLGAPVKSVSVGNSHFMMLTEKGDVFGCGSNRHHQISDSTAEEFKVPQLLDSVSCDPIASVFCVSDLSVFLDVVGVCYVCGKTNSRKDIRFPESFDLTESAAAFADLLGRNGAVQPTVSGCDKRIAVSAGNELFEWTSETALKFKAKRLSGFSSKYQRMDFKRFQASKSIELVEFRRVCGTQCQISVSSEKVTRSEPFEVKVAFKDADGHKFKSESSRDIISLLMVKTGAFAKSGNSNVAGFNSILHSESNFELRNASDANLFAKNVRFIGEAELAFDLRFDQVGLYVFQAYCNEQRMKGEFMMEVLRSNESGEPSEEQSIGGFNAFLTSSSFKSIATATDGSEPPKTSAEEAPVKLHPIPASVHKLKPIETEGKSIFTIKRKQPTARFSSIKIKRNESAQSMLDDKLPVKLSSKLPPMPDKPLFKKTER